MFQGSRDMSVDPDRARLIAELASLVQSGQMPEDARSAGLTLIGWLARRMPGEGPHTSCCTAMLERARSGERAQKVRG
jgi:hypothetical protein